MTTGAPHTAWIDVETTGVDTRTGDQLLQLAIIITDEKFNELGTLESKFYFTPEEVTAMRNRAIDFVKNMHDTTGLWDELSNESNPSQAEFDETLLEWIKTFEPEALKLYFGGNSLFLDREFMREYLPKSYAHLSHQSIDMSSVEIFMLGTDNRAPFKKARTHDALDDIRECIAQGEYHRELSVVPF